VVLYNYVSDFAQRATSRRDLSKNINAIDILFDHPLDCGYLAYNPL
jgi:hypothetical protein